jgi:hypothetical protein
MYSIGYPKEFDYRKEFLLNLVRKLSGPLWPEEYILQLIPLRVHSGKILHPILDFLKQNLCLYKHKN